MKQVSVTTLFVLLCVGMTHTAAVDDQFKLVLQHIDLLRLQVQLLQSRKLRALTRCFTVLRPRIILYIHCCEWFSPMTAINLVIFYFISAKEVLFLNLRSTPTNSYNLKQST